MTYGVYPLPDEPPPGADTGEGYEAVVGEEASASKAEESASQ